jgi:SAM-dependent methyltransferase
VQLIPPAPASPPAVVAPAAISAPPEIPVIDDSETPALAPVQERAKSVPPPPPQLPPELGIEAGGHARATPPTRRTQPPPRRSEPPQPAHVIVPPDPTAAPKPTPAPAIQVMRIIAIGKPGAAPPADDIVENDLEEIPGEPDHDEETPTFVHIEIATEEALAAPPAPDATELLDDDLTPDSQEGRKLAEAGVAELDRDDALSIPPELPDTELTTPSPVPEAPPENGSAPVSDAKPPPPPLRRPKPPRRPDSGRPRARRTLKRPWWEEIFGEDFTRAVPKVSEKQIVREVDFIEESLGVAKGGVVLDLGCGSGHHAVELASRGYGVVGYDLSVYQLALAADVAQERDQKINFLQGDMREMAFEAMFDGIYCWNTSFGYFEEDKNAAVAERVFRALKPGGMFLIDIANRDFAASYSPSQLWYEGDSCVCMDDMSVDFITSRLRVKRSVIFDDGRSRECVYSIRLYSLHELGKLLHDVGFRVTEASGQPSTPGVFFGELSPRLIVLAQKP